MKRFISCLLAISAISLFFSCSVVSNNQNNSGGGGDGSNPPVNPVYVSTNGNDTNSGLSAGSPLRYLQTAVNLAKTTNSTALYINGNYLLTNTNNLSNSGIFLDGLTNLVISGGWNDSFSSQTGESVLNGGWKINTVIFMQYCRGLTLTNLLVTGGTNNSDFGGGIYANEISYCSNFATVSNNFASYGGGLYLLDSHHNLISGYFVSNTTLNYGGGLYLDVSHSNTITADLFRNVARGGSDPYGGAMEVFNSGFNTITGNLIENYSSGCGGAVDIFGSWNNTFNANILSNRATTGGGIYDENNGSIFGGGTNNFGGVIAYNTATNGGGVYISLSRYEIYSAVITNNFSFNNGGGLYLDNSYSNTFTSSSIIQYNHCDIGNTGSYTGGGIYFDTSLTNTMQTGATNPNFKGSETTNTNNFYFL